MFKKIEEYLQKQKQAVAQRGQLRKAQAYFRLIKAGNAFIQFVQEDIKKNGDKMNRHQRRRMEHDINERGVLSPEVVEYYQQRIDMALANINYRLNPPKPQKTAGYQPNKGVLTTPPNGNSGVQVRSTPPPEVKK